MAVMYTIILTLVFETALYMTDKFRLLLRVYYPEQSPGR